MNSKNNSNKLSRHKASWNGSGKPIYYDKKKPDKPIKYFKEIVIPEHTNYNYPLTTIPYITVFEEPDFIENEHVSNQYKNYNERFENKTTVGDLPRQLGNYFKYCEA